LLAGLLNYSSTLKMEAIRSSETSGTTLRTTRCHIPEEDTLHKKRCFVIQPLSEVYLIYATRRKFILLPSLCVWFSQHWLIFFFFYVRDNTKFHQIPFSRIGDETFGHKDRDGTEGRTQSPRCVFISRTSSICPSDRSNISSPQILNRLLDSRLLHAPVVTLACF
jgi:hypothetical protein